MSVVIALRKVELNVTADLEAVSEAVSATAINWATALEDHLKAVGLPSARTVQCSVVPSDELAELLASGRAFRVETDFLLPVAP